jgi:hypothetical protein
MTMRNGQGTKAELYYVSAIKQFPRLRPSSVKEFPRGGIR